MRVFYPVTRLVFKATTATEPLQLYYGNARANAPRYDLALVAGPLLAAPRSTATLSAERAAKQPWLGHEARSKTQLAIFWGALAAVVVGLLFVLARLLPKTLPPTS